MQTITNYGPVSRASISKQTGLSKQTISEIARQLEEDGWIREVGQTQGHIGRRAVTYEVVPEAAYIACVDLGGTKVRAALCDLSCDVVVEQTEPTHASGGTEVTAQIARLIRRAAASKSIPFEKIHAAVVGVPGVLEASTGHVLLAPNIQGIDNIDFIGTLKASLNIDIFVENDVNLAAIGEHWVARNAEHDNLVLISLGTGIGAGIVIAGELVRGAQNAAGEIGFLPFGGDPFEQESLRVGALERVVATFGICHRYHALTSTDKTVPEIFDAAQAGDDAANHVLNETASYLARAIASISAVLQPSCVILGGSIGGRPELQERTRDALTTCFPSEVNVQPSTLGQYAALAGGAVVGLRQLHMTLFAEGLSGTEVTIPFPAQTQFGRRTG